MVAYALQAPAGPFPLMVISFGLAGYGLSLQVSFTGMKAFCTLIFSLQNALGNTYVGCIKTGTPAMLGMLHGSYGEWFHPSDLLYI